MRKFKMITFASMIFSYFISLGAGVMFGVLGDFTKGIYFIGVAIILDLSIRDVQKDLDKEK